MKTKIILISICLSFLNLANADDHVEFGAMEGLQCNFADGKDMDDVMKVISEWNEYGDENFSAPYSAWIFTPVYRTNSDFDFDFMFLGFTTSMQEMGKVQDDWQAGGSKIEEKNVEGGESTLLHLDDWENLKEFSKDPIGRQEFIWGSPKSKNVNYKVKHPVFSDDRSGKPIISYIDQFPEPKNIEQGIFLQKLSDALEESKKKIITKLPTGSTIVANNYFWLHGRKPFKENENLSRELLRIRGIFLEN